ncbi:MAG: hypothetical protein EOP88_07770 [Verrucomicrobiaceae bacterium]|nr:MAG: hypothetical protein EOP88_07770 [Verrucomicrobiaceae bacterium]
MKPSRITTKSHDSPAAPPAPDTEARGTDYPRLILMSLVVVVAVATGILLERHAFRPDLSHEPAPFNTMKMPIQDADIVDYIEMGSGSGEEGIRVEITDEAGIQFRFEFPVDNSRGWTTYPQARHDGKLMENPARVKELCLRMVRLYDLEGTETYLRLAGK